MRVLVVEDEVRQAAALKRGLEAEGFAVDVASSGTDALWLATEQPYDAVVLDVMLPGLNGYRVCAELRARQIWTPVLMLTAKDGELDEAEALDTGADDFLSKPFSYVVLVARLRALLRRAGTTVRSELACGPLVLDHNSRAFSLHGSPLHLSPKEHALLETLLRRAGTTVSKAALLESIYGFDDDVGPGAIEIYVHRLRRKLEDSPVRIATLRGLGYLLRLEER